ncbi:MAG: hypothetical protein WAV31_03830 [Candidatus Moraniibacteriota bacterium]
MKKKSKELKKRKPGDKIEMLECKIISIEAEYLVMLPIGANSVVEGSITWSLKSFPGKKYVLNVGDEVIALNVHRLGDGWRAKSISIEGKELSGHENVRISSTK